LEVYLRIEEVSEKDLKEIDPLGKNWVEKKKIDKMMEDAPEGVKALTNFYTPYAMQRFIRNFDKIAHYNVSQADLNKW
jgi:hypothetical protein